jgi:hypothetical protein
MAETREQRIEENMRTLREATDKIAEHLAQGGTIEDYERE